MIFLANLFKQKWCSSSKMCPHQKIVLDQDLESSAGTDSEPRLHIHRFLFRFKFLYIYIYILYVYTFLLHQPR